jgi:hypothetical protein
MIFFDTETCGLHGFIVLLQYAEDDGPIVKWDIWKNPIGDTLELLERIASQPVCGFNLAFDWFHIAKCYTTFAMVDDYDKIPEDDIDEIAILEEKARASDFCIKPASACDIMLHARKGPYQSLMKRHPIRVKRIPTRLSYVVRDELERVIHLDDIHFAKRKDKTATQWKIADCFKSDGDLDPNFKDIVLTLHPSGQLKELAKHALNVKEDVLLRYTDISPDSAKIKELGYAPYALAVGTPDDWKNAWPRWIQSHISHWKYHSLARQYAEDDVTYTRGLYEYFGSPEPGDDDSELACMVGAVRWKGFAINEYKLRKLRERALRLKGTTPTAPGVVKKYISLVMDSDEEMVLQEGTGAEILESIAGKKGSNGVWDHSLGWLLESGEPHPAAVRAREVLESRRAAKEIENYDKLLLAKRFHASLKVIGTKSSRMSGADDLNAQGIKHDAYVRECFPLADFDKGFVLSGGDFDAFEVVLAEADYQCDKLRADLLAGKKIHGLFAEELFGIPYEQVMATAKTTNHYTDGKRGIFLNLYGGTPEGMAQKLGIPEDTAIKASEGFAKRYPGVGRARKRIFEQFCSMRQPGGIGSQVIWHEPAESIESLLGFKRYFTLENKVCKALFKLGENPPKAWEHVRIKVKRRDRLQTAAGACRSAMFAAAFAVQASNMRAAANHRIQSSGAQITKAVQRKIWDLQPIGVAQWVVQPLNIHDEIHVAQRPETVDQVATVVHNEVESYRERVPLIKMEWTKEEKSWADK